MHAQGMAEPLEGVLHPADPKDTSRTFGSMMTTTKAPTGCASMFWAGTR